MKKILCILIGIFLLVGSAGCTNDTMTFISENSEGDRTNYVVRKEPKLILRIKENEMEKPDKTNNIFSSSLVFFDINKIWKLLMVNSSSFNREDYSDASVLEGTEETITLVNPGLLTYSTEHFDKKLYEIYASLYGGKEGFAIQDYDNSINLAFSEETKVIQDTEELLRKIGIDNCRCTSIAAISFEEEEKIAKELVKRGLIDGENTKATHMYNAKEEMYILKFRKFVGDIPIAQITHGNPDDDTFVMGCAVDCVVTSEGIEYLNVDSAYMLRDQKEAVKIISYEEALKTVVNKYDQMIMNNDVIVDNAYINYVPIIEDKRKNVYSLTPCWIFDAHEEVINADGTVFSNDVHVIVNGLNGMEVI